MEMGKRLAYLRNKRNLSQKELADKLNYSQSSIAMWENGKRRVPDEAKEVLADFYNVSLDYLHGRNATSQDEIDLQEMLESNIAMTYGGEELTESEKQRVQDILTGIFWEKTHKERDKGAD